MTKLHEILRSKKTSRKCVDSGRMDGWMDGGSVDRNDHLAYQMFYLGGLRGAKCRCGVVGAAPCTWTGGLPAESRHEVNPHATPLASLRCAATALLSSYSASKQNVPLHPPESISLVS